MVRDRAAVVLMLSLAGATPAAAADPPVLAPSSPWSIDYDADSCALIRSFGSGEHQAYLEIRRFAPGWGLQTTVASNRVSARENPDLRYRFTGEERWQKPALGVSVTVNDTMKGVIFEPALPLLPEWEALGGEAEREAYFSAMDFRAIERQQAAATNSLSVHGLGPEFTLRLGKLEAPITALQDCVDELTTHWNIDVEAHKTLTRRASPVNFRAGSKMLDYPPAMLMRSMPGLVNIRLAIDETGNITGCRIQMPLSDPEFEESSCADIQHAFDFEPALDKDGKPLASYWTTKVVFTF